MNDATELESSLNGAIDFFQNLHRKLGTLETETVTRHDQLQTLSTTLVTLQKDRQADQQTLAHLSSGVLKLQADSRVLEQQLNTVEGLASGFQQDQQRLQDTLSNVVNDLRTQDEQWRQGFAQTLGQQAQTLQTQVMALESQWTQHQERFGALEQTARAGHEQIEQVSTIIESQYKRLLKFDMALENFDQHSRSLNQTLGALKTDFERHEQTLQSLKQASGLDEMARQQLQVQQDRLERLTASATAAEQHGQIVQQDVAQLKNELDAQRGLLADAVQVRQDVQKNQDRLKHLETLMTKVATDTNSTRQILNVVQSDLTTQSDTLRELDQHWNDTLGNYQDRLSWVEARLTGSMPPPAMLPEPAPAADSSASPAIDPERLEALEAALATACSQHNQGLMALERELSAIQITLDQQDAHIGEWQGALAEPLGAVQQRLGELESTLDHLRQSIEAGSATESNTDTVLDNLRQALAEQSAALEETQQLAWSQIQDLQQRLSEAEATLDSAPPASEPVAVGGVDLDATLAHVRSEMDATLDELRQALAEQSAALEETQQLAWSQIQDLQQRLSEAEATLDSAPPASEPVAVGGVDLDATLAHVRSEVDVTLDELRQALAEQSAALEETQQLAWLQIQDLQQRLSEAEATLDSAPPASEPVVAAMSAESDAALASLREDVSVQAGTLETLQESVSAQAGTLVEFREATQQQLTDLTATLETQQQDFHDAVNQIANLQQDIRQLQQPAAPDQAIDSQRLETAELYAQEVRQDLDALQETVTALETRISSQSQAFSGHFEQFRNLNADIQALQQQMARLDASPRQLGVIDQELAAHEQDIAQIKEVVEQIQADSQQMGSALQQQADSPVAEVVAQLGEQQEQLTQLASTVESIRADSKASQETVVTMATNVAKRIHEIQNLLVATENTQSERLQEVEQKLIHLQAAFETLENQRKPRKWFNMPASLTSVIMLTVGAGGLMVLAQVIWIID